MSAGLPNITGNFKIGGAGAYQSLAAASGVFSVESIGSAVSMGSGSNTKNMTQIAFSATSSSSIYGNSDTVQPAAVCINFCIKY